MVSRQDRTRALMFVYDRLVASGMYEVQELEQDLTHLVLTDDPNHHLGASDLRRYVVACAPFFDTVAEFQVFCQEQTRQGNFVAPLLYKGTDHDPHKARGFVRMVEVSKAHRKNKSFKLYLSEQINEILHLRDNELAVCDLVGNDVVYFQASKGAEKESVIQGYGLVPVNLDYNHLSEAERQRKSLSDGPSRIYRIPEFLFEVTARDALQLIVHDRRSHLAVLNHTLTVEQASAEVEAELTSTAVAAFRGFKDEPAEALYHLRDDPQHST